MRPAGSEVCGVPQKASSSLIYLHGALSIWAEFRNHWESPVGSKVGVGVGRKPQGTLIGDSQEVPEPLGLGAKTGDQVTVGGGVPACTTWSEAGRQVQVTNHRAGLPRVPLTMLWGRAERLNPKSHREAQGEGSRSPPPRQESAAAFRDQQKLGRFLVSSLTSPPGGHWAEAGLPGLCLGGTQDHLSQLGTHLQEEARQPELPQVTVAVTLA